MKDPEPDANMALQPSGQPPGTDDVPPSPKTNPALPPAQGELQRGSLERKDAMLRGQEGRYVKDLQTQAPSTSTQNIGSYGSLELAPTLQNAPGVLAGSQGWLLRAHNRTQELCKWFGLPLNETLLDEFHCALRKRVLLQGRMYVFDHYVCFSSSVFGFVKRKVMPFAEIVGVRKKTHLRFPNSIEIELLPRANSTARRSVDGGLSSVGGSPEDSTAGGSPHNEREFFTSFLSREDAFRLIFNCWSQARPELAAALQESLRHKSQRQQQPPPAAANTPESASGSSGMLGGAMLGGVGNIIGGMTKLLTAGVAHQAPGRRISTLDYVEGGSTVAEQGSRITAGPSRAGRRTDSSLPGPAPGMGTVSTGGSCSAAPGQGGQGGGPGAQGGGAGLENLRGMEKLSGTLYGRAEDEDDDDEGEDGAAAVWSVVEPHSAPQVSNEARPVLSVVLPGTPRDFFDTLLADASHLLEDFYEAQGNRRINLTPWKRHEQLGHVRDISFVAPIKGAFGNWGVSHTQCYQSHRFCQYQGQHLVFESSQTMTDIPYGDCFTVDVRWDIKPALGGEPGEDTLGPLPSALNGFGSGLELSAGGSPSQVVVDISVRVPFTRRCLFKKVIESGTHKQVGDTYSALIEEVRRALEEVMANKPGVLRSVVSHAQPPLSAMPSMRHLGASEMVNDIGTPRGRNSFMSRVPSQMQANEFPGSFSVPVSATQPAGGRGVVQVVQRAVAEWLSRVWEFFMGVLSDSMSPQLRTLTLVVLCVFVVQVIMCFAVLRHQGHSHGHSTPAPTTPLPAAVLPAAPQLIDPGADLGGGMVEGLAQSYWAQRMGLLNAELGLLQQRMEAVAREMQLVAQYAQSGAAGGSGGGAGEVDKSEL